MRILVDRDQNPDSTLVSFCEVVTRDPFFLVGREAPIEFNLADLTDLRLATVSEVPTPWICLQEDLRSVGVDPTTLNRVAYQTMAVNTDALRSGTMDVIQVFEPFVEQLVSDGVGHIWYAGAGRGPTSYTSFYTTEQTLIEERDTMSAMTRAIFRTQRWLHDSDAVTIAKTLAGYFPNLAPTTLASCIARYKSHGLWGRDPFLSKDGFEQLKRSCLSGGLIQHGAAYDLCVDNSLISSVIADDPPDI